MIICIQYWDVFLVSWYSSWYSPTSSVHNINNMAVYSRVHSDLGRENTYSNVYSNAKNSLWQYSSIWANELQILYLNFGPLKSPKIQDLNHPNFDVTLCPCIFKGLSKGISKQALIFALRYKGRNWLKHSYTVMKQVHENIFKMLT